MLPGRRFAAAATAISLIAVGFFRIAPAAAASNACADVTVLPPPFAPWSGAPLRVMVIAEKPVEGSLSLIAPDGKVAVKSTDRHEGPPYSWFAEVTAPAAGTWHATLERTLANCGPVTRDIAVGARKPEPFKIPAGSIWQTRNNWNSTNEALFSAWIEKLFDAPPDQDLNWKVWYEVLRDPSRNFLHNYLGRNEDTTQTGLRPDCADFVYFLRAYFAFKMGLPFGYSNCSRGAGGEPPECPQWFDVDHPEVTRPPPPPDKTGAPDAEAVATPAPPPPQQKSTFMRLFGGQAEPASADAPEMPPAKAAPPKPKRPTNFGEYLRDVGDVVHTGSVRAGDDAADFYTIPLTKEALRPGTVFADPYGHVLMIV